MSENREMSNELLDLDYPFLKREGIKYVQQLAGKIWTDYSEHDPGITILEELCFAIIDLEYRTNFYMEDILALNPNATQEKNIKQFYYAEEILPCNPLTIKDFLKIIIDVPGVKNASILLSDGVQEIKGGYKVFFDIEERARKHFQEEVIKEKVIQKLHQYRNLCEDFFVVKCMDLQPIRINASFELVFSPAYEEAEMLIAQIYCKIQDFLAPRINFFSLGQMVKKGKTVDQIFTGPLLEHGFIDDEELETSYRSEIYTAKILEQITSLPAIKSVLKFEALFDGSSGEKKVTILKDFHIALKLAIEQSEILLSYNEVPIIIDQEKVMCYYDSLVGEKRLDNTYVNKELVSVQEGNYRDLTSYVSIQQDFPLVYNVGDEGSPLSATEAYKGKVKQLKGYLMFFDQMLANYFEQLANIKNRMAIRSDAWERSNGQLPKEVPYLEMLIRDTAASVTDDLTSGVSAHDNEFKIQRKYLGILLEGIENEYSKQDRNKYYLNYLNKLLSTSASSAARRGNMLDHLLARFSEVFATYALSSYAKTKVEKLEHFNRDKSRFLQDYIAISKDRNKGVNVLDSDIEYWRNKNISGFERRIYYKLGIKQLKKRFLYDILHEHICLEKHVVKNNFAMFLGKGIKVEYDNFLVFKGKFRQIRDLVLRYGIYEANYNIVKKTDESYSIMLYVDKAQQHTIEVVNDKKPFLSIKDAEKVIGENVSFFNAFSKESEGFHLVEHILLRNSTSLQGNTDPYSFIMTMVFPAWPSRFQDNAFRNAVQEMVLLESPAHIFVNILWLDFQEMKAFEEAYKEWVEIKTAPKEDAERLHQVAKSLLGLIMLYTRN